MTALTAPSASDTRAPPDQVSAFEQYIKEIATRPDPSKRLDVHIVLDNYCRPTRPRRCQAWLVEKRGALAFVHCTPYVRLVDFNPIERWFADLTRKQLQSGVHHSKRQLEADIRALHRQASVEEPPVTLQAASSIRRRHPRSRQTSSVC